VDITMPDTDEQILDPGFLGKALEIDDWDILADFYATFLQQLNPLLLVLENDRKSLSVGELHHQAHKMGSSCRTVGASPLARLFETLENLCRENATAAEIEHVLLQILSLGHATATAVDNHMQHRDLQGNA
jgi:HPt (histidine-containing phosphotransfer) domain-containing protein